MQDSDQRLEGRREKVERRRKVRRGLTQRTKIRRVDDVPVEVERRYILIRRMSKRRELTRRREDRRRGIDRRMQTLAERPLKK